MFFPSPYNRRKGTIWLKLWEERDSESGVEVFIGCEIGGELTAAY